jgi:hypothetical protein
MIKIQKVINKVFHYYRKIMSVNNESYFSQRRVEAYRGMSAYSHTQLNAGMCYWK